MLRTLSLFLLGALLHADRHPVINKGIYCEREGQTRPSPDDPLQMICENVPGIGRRWTPHACYNRHLDVVQNGKRYRERIGRIRREYIRECVINKDASGSYEWSFDVIACGYWTHTGYYTIPVGSSELLDGKHNCTCTEDEWGLYTTECTPDF